MSGDTDPLLADGKAVAPRKRVDRFRESLSEQTPSVLLLLALLFGIVAGVVAYVYSKYGFSSRSNSRHYEGSRKRFFVQSTLSSLNVDPNFRNPHKLPNTKIDHQS